MIQQNEMLWRIGMTVSGENPRKNLQFLAANEKLNKLEKADPKITLSATHKRPQPEHSTTGRS